MYLVYRTVHIPTGRFYIGRHITDDIDDGYFGSGSDPLLKDKENLSREVLRICENPEEMIKLEREMIKEWINHPKCMNQIIGDISRGGVLAHSEENKRRISDGTKEALKNLPPESRERMIEGAKKAGKYTRTPETLALLSKIRKGVPKSEAFKRQVSLTQKGKVFAQVSCLNCRQSGAVPAMTRHHLKGCKK